MDNVISNEYIENAIEELMKSLGVKEPVLSGDIFDNMRSGKVKEAIKIIARLLGLPIDVELIDVPVNSSHRQGENQFHTTHLVKTDHRGTGIGSITAQVLIPKHLPFYSSPSLKDYTIKVKVSSDCAREPVAFAMVMAHELSHVLLHSLYHPQKENEFYTDLTAMLLGFQDIYKAGRKIVDVAVTPIVNGRRTTTTTTTYGYLSDSQFNFALHKINSILADKRAGKNRLSDRIKKLNDTLSEYEETLCEFKKHLDYLVKHTDVRISAADGKRITEFFQPGYMEDLDLAVNGRKTRLEEIRKFLNNLKHYTAKNVDLVEGFSKELTSCFEQLNQKLAVVEKDAKMLGGYTGYRYRITAFFRRLFLWGK